MSICIGSPAPDFTLVTIGADGPETITLSDLIGTNHLVILFFPMAFTSVCTEELCDISNTLSIYSSLDATVLGISGDGPFAQQVWAKQEGISLTLLSDYEHLVAQAYGIAYTSFLPEANLIMGGVPKRSAFVIDKKGIIRHIDIQENPKDMPNFVSIQECLHDLNKTG